MPSSHRPSLELSTIPNLVRSLYGLEISVVRELVSYQDQNFLVQPRPSAVESGSSGTDGAKPPAQFVLKINNSVDSENTDRTDAQIEITLHVKRAAFPTPGPVRTLDGQFQATPEVVMAHPNGPRHEKCVVRLYEFMPGVPLFDVTLTPKLCYEAGACAGRFDSILKNFPVHEHPCLSQPHSEWHPGGVPWLLSKLQAVRNAEQRQTCREIIQAFEENVLRRQDKFLKGIIHNDLNDCNILVQAETDCQDCNGNLETAKGHNGNTLDPSDENDSQDEPVYHIEGLIDLGEVTYSLYLCEVAIQISYAMLKPRDVSPITAAACVLAGYLKVIALPLAELRFLKVSICARFVQSLVCGYFTSQEDPQNDDYILIHVKSIWPVLKTLWAAPDDEVLAQLLVYTDYANGNASE